MGDAQVRWGGVGEREMSVQAMGEMGKNFCPNFLQTFLERNIDRRRYNDGNRELIPVFHNHHNQHLGHHTLGHHTLGIECKGVLSTGVDRMLVGNRVGVDLTRSTINSFAPI